mmetsp:Transcript_1259/g.4088  ORF Transcript_1259/g.4088 Transcript_1259/m.4088 type:complete len:270 (-) Transcript_1259:906-1715(-)
MRTGMAATTTRRITTPSSCAGSLTPWPTAPTCRWAGVPLRERRLAWVASATRRPHARSRRRLKTRKVKMRSTGRSSRRRSGRRRARRGRSRRPGRSTATPRVAAPATRAGTPRASCGASSTAWTRERRRRRAGRRTRGLKWTMTPLVFSGRTTSHGRGSGRRAGTSSCARYGMPRATRSGPTSAGTTSATSGARPASTPASTTRASCGSSWQAWATGKKRHRVIVRLANSPRQRTLRCRRAVRVMSGPNTSSARARRKRPTWPRGSKMP